MKNCEHHIGEQPARNFQTPHAALSSTRCYFIDDIAASASASASTSAESGGPFSDDTIINFSGQQTATPSNSQNPYTNSDADANAAATLGGGANASSSPLYGDSDASDSGIPTSYLLIGGAVIVIGIIGFVILKKKKVI